MRPAPPPRRLVPLSESHIRSPEPMSDDQRYSGLFVDGTGERPFVIVDGVRHWTPTVIEAIELLVTMPASRRIIVGRMPHRREIVNTLQNLGFSITCPYTQRPDALGGLLSRWLGDDLATLHMAWSFEEREEALYGPADVHTVLHIATDASVLHYRRRKGVVSYVTHQGQWMTARRAGDSGHLEYAAIIAALSDFKTTHGRLVIMSDNTSAVTMARQWWKHIAAADSTAIAEVEIVHVSGHRDHALNETADRLARNARREFLDKAALNRILEPIRTAPPETDWRTARIDWLTNRVVSADTEPASI